MFSRRQIFAPVLVILLLAWAAGGPLRSGQNGDREPQSQAAPTPGSNNGRESSDLPAPFDGATNGLRLAGTPLPPTLFFHPVHESEGFSPCGVCRVDLSYLDPFPNAGAEGEADYHFPLGPLDLPIVSNLGPFFGLRPNLPSFAPPPSLGGVGVPVPEPGSGALALLGVLLLTLAGRLCRPPFGERSPSLVRSQRVPKS